MIEYFRNAFEAVSGAVLVVDEDGLIVLANADLNDIFGYAEGELEGQLMEILVPDEFKSGHPELRDAYNAVPNRRAMAGERLLYGLHKDGKLLPLEIGLSPLESPDGRYSVAAVRDVSSRLAEQRRTRQTIDASASAMVMADSEGRIVMANAAAGKMFRRAPETLLGSEIEELIPHRYRRRHGVYRTSYHAEPTARSMGSGSTLFGLRSDGSEFPVEIGLTPIDDGVEQMIMATLVDITRSQEEIQRQNENLKRLNDQLTRFAYSASHDLKAPLTTLDGLLACVDQDAEAGDLEEIRLNATRAQAVAQRLAMRIESTLGVAKTLDVDGEVHPTPLRHFVSSAGQGLAAALDENDVSLHIDIADDLTPHLDGSLLFPVLENLIGNATKFADATKQERFVAVSAAHDGECLRIAVSDNGVGIPKSAQSEVFKRFRRFGDSNVGGAGIGLSLVHQYVERMGGAVSFTSSTAGTHFDVLIPCECDSITLVAKDAKPTTTRAPEPAMASEPGPDMLSAPEFWEVI